MDLDRIYTRYHRFIVLSESFSVMLSKPTRPRRFYRFWHEKVLFYVVSLPEITAVLEHKVPPHRLSYGNTIKKEEDIEKVQHPGMNIYV